VEGSAGRVWRALRESPMALRATKPDEAANCRSNGINDLGGVFRGVADGPTGHRR
jgi:hypothetical protein